MTFKASYQHMGVVSQQPVPPPQAVSSGATGSWQYVPSPGAPLATHIFMMEASEDKHYQRDRNEFRLDCYTHLTFDQWRLKYHPDHIPVPEMPKSSTIDKSQEVETLLEYKPAIFATEDPNVDTLLGESQRSSTKLPDRNSLLVDLGSRINLIGRNTAQEFITAAHVHGQKAKTKTKERPLYVHGVGSGSAQCKEVMSAAVAVKYEASAPQVANYEANIADGCGADLPAIYGLDSMTKGDAVILLREGKRCIAFPGKGGYKITWSEGTKLLPLQESPSGHLVIPCDSFDGADQGCPHAFITDNFSGCEPTPAEPTKQDSES